MSSTLSALDSGSNLADPAQFSPQRQPLADPKADLRQRMQRQGQWMPQQLAGRRWNMACVSLEITQRCNLDCTLCYLSDAAEAVLDFPLEEIFRRIDMILAHYGPGTDVQVSGGEPTLRAREELVAIVRRISSLGMRASLFTNGIKATRVLLMELADAGLTDVAFHVDTTQQREGYANEADLNALRTEYIERGRGLPISVFFNTTVHAGNFADVAMLAAFFVAHADVVRFASFQLQAETGRGVLGARAELIGNDSVARRLQAGVSGGGRAELKWNVLAAGHHDCNRNAVMLVVNGKVYDAFTDADFVRRFAIETADVTIDRGTPWRGLRSLLSAMRHHPALSLAALGWVLRQAWLMKWDLIAARGKVHKLTFFTHNFMDACALDAGRIDACVFMAITQDGPLSMCAFNAQRDSYLLRPLKTKAGLWRPLREELSTAAVPSFPIKWLKGKPREQALQRLRQGVSINSTSTR